MPTYFSCCTPSHRKLRSLFVIGLASTLQCEGKKKKKRSRVRNTRWSVLGVRAVRCMYVYLADGNQLIYDED